MFRSRERGPDCGICQHPWIISFGRTSAASRAFQRLLQWHRVVTSLWLVRGQAPNGARAQVQVYLNSCGYRGLKGNRHNRPFQSQC
jgi:hypothetical protein